MKLSRLTLRNFRSCESAEVTFADDLTVLVGENASGKSAIIDAIRLVTNSALERKSITFSASTDPTHWSAPAAPVEISARYGSLSESEKAIFMTSLVDSHDDLIHTVSFSRDQELPYWKSTSSSVGDLRVDDPEPVNRRRIAHVYLPPLRDAVRELDSGSGDRLAEVLRVLTAGDKRAELEQFRTEANAVLGTIAEMSLPTRATTEIQAHLTQITPPTRKHEVRLGGRVQELRRLAGLMRMQLADARIDPMQISSSGLGYANLLFIATIVVQLANAKDYDLLVLLVEEPEAHLHPQLQAVLLSYLKQQAQNSRKPKACASLDPAGRIQVVVSTHSPNLASARVVVVADPDQSIYEFRRATPAAFQDFRTRFAPREVVVLNEDYRSSEAICQVVTSLRSVGHDRIQSKANFSGLPFASSVYVIAGDAGFQRKQFAALADRFDICQNGRVVLASTRAAAAELSGQPSATQNVKGASGRLLQALSVLGYSGAGEARRVAVLRIERMLLDSFAWGGALERGSVDQRLEALGIDRTYLRFVTRRLLVTSGTWVSREEAHMQVKALLVETLTPLCVPTKQIGQRFKAIDMNDWKFWLDARSNAGRESTRIQALHIHAVKGAEFEAVLLGFVDQKPRGRPHVLDTWALSNTTEDRRVIYVGASRAKRLLAFAVSPRRRAALEQILIHDSVPFETISAP